MKFDSIVLFMRPGEMSEIASWIHDNIIDNVADVLDIPVYYHLDHKDSIAMHDNSLFVAIGGDGTMLRAMDVSVKTNIYNNANTSVIGFNAGNVGFLTEDPHTYEPGWALMQIWNGKDNFKLENRLALSTVIDDRYEHFAINEFTFTPTNIAAPLHYQISINGKFVAKHIGSGCMVSTPTGSTAMAMSAGGAIICPSSDVMQIVPIIPHTLTSRPVVTSAGDEITLMSDMDRVDKVVVSSDGREIHTFTEDANITVRRAAQPVRVWYSIKREFFDILSTKLDW